MRIRTRIAVSLVASSAGACTIMAGFDDLQGAATDPNLIADASHDGATSNVGDGNADSTDAAADSSLSATPFCSLPANATALFCDDFDEGAFGSRWDNLANNFQKFGEYTSNDFVSGSRSLHVTYNSAGDTSAYFQKALNVASMDGIQVDFDVKSTSFEYARWFGMNLSSPSDQIGVCRHFLFENGPGDGSYQAWLNNAAFPQDGWAHVTLKLEKNQGTAANGALTLLVNSSVIHNRVSPLNASMLSLSTLQLRLGIFFSAAATWEAWLDNFVVTKL